jgi:hypothetical protein
VKTCANCGRTSKDNAKICEDCGTNFPASSEAAPVVNPGQHEMKRGSQLPLSVKWCLFLAAWGFVLVKCLVWNPQSILVTPFFPIGLVAWLPNGEEKAIFVWFVGGWIVGWALYAFLAFLIFKVKNLGLFVFIYALLLLLLVLNIAGCKRVVEAASGIH